MMPLEMMPVGANGENAAALQAPTTSSVIRNAGILTRPAIAIATGAISAQPAMLPGPIVVKKSESKKIMIGIKAVLPLQTRME